MLRQKAVPVEGAAFLFYSVFNQQLFEAYKGRCTGRINCQKVGLNLILHHDILLVQFVRYFQLLMQYISRNSWIAIFWTLLILLACSWPGKDIPEVQFEGFDKVVHVGLFMTWTVLWLLVYPTKSVHVILAGIAYGIGIEFYQQIMPLDRSFDWLDIAADSVGVFLGFGFKALVLDRYLQRLY